jgi:predicted Ser/Thr protein kinase
VSDDPVTTTQAVSGSVPTWGSLQIIEEIGRGGFGVVYRAWEPALAREVALKIIRPRGEDQPEALANILREGQLLARVRHPNVVAVHGALQAGEEVGIWMEFVRGRSLSRLVKDDGPRAAGEAAVIGISLCQAMAAVHRAGVIHRDIKAHNVMREAGGRIVLMDFGAGQVFDGPRRPEERAIGTPAYMAPEVLAGGQATPRSDIYSLGVLLYYLVSGAYPVEGETWTDYLLAHARFERRPLGDVRPDIPARFVRIVERATALNPDDRYASPGAMLADLTAAAAGGQRRSSRSESRRRKAAPRTPTPVWPFAAAAGLLLGILALGAVSSAAFNHTLGRPAAYAGESVWTWWKWGLRALIPGAVQATIVVLLAMLATAIWRVLTRVSTSVAALGRGLSGRRRALAARMGVNEPEIAAQALLAAQIVAVAAFCWHFRDIFSAMFSFIDTAAAAEIEALRQPEHLERHQLYNFAMAMLILAMTAAAAHVLRMHRRTGRALHASVFGVAGVIVIAFVILVLPYRLIWHNAFEIAAYRSQQCYILGEHPASALLYCPDDAAPRVKAIPLPADDLDRSGRWQSIYTR